MCPPRFRLRTLMAAVAAMAMAFACARAVDKVGRRWEQLGNLANRHARMALIYEEWADEDSCVDCVPLQREVEVDPRTPERVIADVMEWRRRMRGKAEGHARSSESYRHRWW